MPRGECGANIAQLLEGREEILALSDERGDVAIGSGAKGFE